MLARNETSEIWDFHKDDAIFMEKFLLMDTPTTAFLILALYIVFVLKLGPQLMKNRPPYNLNNILRIYNALQVVSSAYVVYMGAPILWNYGLKPKCLNNTGDKIGYLSSYHIFYLLKIIELLDTVFFVLRKKFNQVTFLHVYHHSYMVISTWFIFKYDPTYAMLFPVALNSFIHVVMYTYYGLSAFPALAKYLWWKKYITSMQMVQFVMINSHLLRSYYTSKCPPTFLMAYSMIANCTLFFLLFADFYIKSYRKTKKIIQNVGENGGLSNGVENTKIVKIVGVKDYYKTGKCLPNSNNFNIVEDISNVARNSKIVKCSAENYKVANCLAHTYKKIM